MVLTGQVQVAMHGTLANLFSTHKVVSTGTQHSYSVVVFVVREPSNDVGSHGTANWLRHGPDFSIDRAEATNTAVASRHVVSESRSVFVPLVTDLFSVC